MDTWEFESLLGRMKELELPESATLMPYFSSYRQIVVRFPNGYGASIINDGYGRDEGLVEIAVIQFDENDDWDICYDTPVTDDVLGFLDREDVLEVLAQIEALDN